MRVFCSICKEIFVPYSEIKATNCGHLYHGSCITRWTKQHKTCPQCRSNLTSQPFKIYFDVEEGNGTDPSTLEHQIEVLSDKLRETEFTANKLKEEKELCERIMEEMKDCSVALKNTNETLKTSLNTLKDKMFKESKKCLRLENELQMWMNKASTLEGLEHLLTGTTEEVNKMLKFVPVTEKSVRQLCTYVGILKEQSHKCEEKNIKLTKDNKKLSKLLAENKKKSSDNSEEIIKNLETSITLLQNEIQILKKINENSKKPQSHNNNSEKFNSKDSPKKLIFEMNLDILDEVKENNSKQQKGEELKQTINKWEDFVCAGPSKVKRAQYRSRSFHTYSSNHENEKDVSRAESNFAFDGMGGRKKIRLNTITPEQEFKMIKRNVASALDYKKKY